MLIEHTKRNMMLYKEFPADFPKIIHPHSKIKYREFLLRRCAQYIDKHILFLAAEKKQ